NALAAAGSIGLVCRGGGGAEVTRTAYSHVVQRSRRSSAARTLGRQRRSTEPNRDGVQHHRNAVRVRRTSVRTGRTKDRDSVPHGIVPPRRGGRARLRLARTGHPGRTLGDLGPPDAGGAGGHLAGVPTGVAPVGARL